MTKIKVLVSDSKFITIEEALDVAYRNAKVQLSDDSRWRKKLQKSADILKKAWESDTPIYGVTTGVGDSVDVPITAKNIQQLQLNIYKMHGCGLGNYLDEVTARIVLLARLKSYTFAYSGIREVFLERLTDLLNKGITPVIPEEGSVGASGDLTPLSYVAAVLYGEREVYYKGEKRQTAEVYEELGIRPLVPLPKETLAIMNGTCVMTAIACIAYHRAKYLSKLASRLSAMAAISLLSNLAHFDERIFKVKPHEGQMKVAKSIAKDCNYDKSFSEHFKGRLQAPYSIRCAPYVIGVLEDALPWIKKTIEIEFNSANDNPLIDVENGDFLFSGNFYGGHIAFAMDSLKNAIASIADLLDRQFAVLIDHKTNNGLPSNLSGAIGKMRCINHGFKAVQIMTTSLTAEALKNTMPMTAFSRSTESHNQDKVSMGTTAARDCLRVIELTEKVAACVLPAFTQAIKIRMNTKAIHENEFSEGLQKTLKQVLGIIGFVDEDRALEGDLRQLIQMIQEQKITLDD